MDVRKLWVIIPLSVLALGIGSACSSNTDDPPAPNVPSVGAPNAPGDDSANNPEPNPSEDEDSNSEGRVSFDEVNDRIIVPRCVECHGASGGVNLEGYDRVKNEMFAIEEVVLRLKMMPPPEKEPLTNEELELLRKWIEQEKGAS